MLLHILSLSGFFCEVKAAVFAIYCNENVTLSFKNTGPPQESLGWENIFVQNGECPCGGETERKCESDVASDLSGRPWWNYVALRLGPYITGTACCIHDGHQQFFLPAGESGKRQKGCVNSSSFIVTHHVFRREDLSAWQQEIVIEDTNDLHEVRLCHCGSEVLEDCTLIFTRIDIETVSGQDRIPPFQKARCCKNQPS